MKEKSSKTAKLIGGAILAGTIIGIGIRLAATCMSGAGFGAPQKKDKKPTSDYDTWWQRHKTENSDTVH